LKYLQEKAHFICLTYENESKFFHIYSQYTYEIFIMHQEQRMFN